MSSSPRPRHPHDTHAAPRPRIRPRPLAAARLAAPLFAMLLFTAAALACWSCASDKPTGPPAGADVKIMDTVFLPPTVTIEHGQSVEWINRSRDHRTVTSGDGPDDPEAGLLFDVDLAGYPPGEPNGGRYRRSFAHPDTVHYFSRFAPPGFPDTIRGTIIVH